jgi:hypothetical protein
MKFNPSPRELCFTVCFSSPGISSLEALKIFKSSFEELVLDLRALTVQKWGETLERLELKLNKKRDYSFSLTQNDTSLFYSTAYSGYSAKLMVSFAAGWYQKLMPILL